MTRYLSSVLGAQQPLFSRSLLELERASGSPGVDIRLSTELTQNVRAKIVELGLDPDDTTGPELYSALTTKLAHDDSIVRTALQIKDDATPTDILARVHAFVDKEVTTCFAMKPAVAKRLLKKKVPRSTMKRLGYRSLESMLKREAIGAIFVATVMAESPAWHRSFREQYASLQSNDFEQRTVHVVLPKTKRWITLSESYVLKTHHNIVCLKELGSIVLLPMPATLPGLAITTLLLTLYYMNDIHAYSSFIKLQQVRPDFGDVVKQSAQSEPMTSAKLANQPVSWKVIQRYYGKLKQEAYPEVFEPHIQPEDFKWRDAEVVLAQLAPVLTFWQDTQYACQLSNEGPVSLNIIDVALSYCNNLSFADRIVHFVREHIWYELMSRYLHQGNLEAAVHEQLNKDLANEAIA